MIITNEMLKERPLSYSSIKEFSRSPKNYIQYLHAKREPSKEMVFGSMIHCLLLYPELFQDMFAVSPDVDRRTKDGKAEWERFVSEAGEREVVQGHELDEASEIVGAVLSNDNIKNAIKNCDHFEKPWQEDMFNLPFRGFLDACSSDYVIEVKTTSDASPQNFTRDFFNRKYHIQAALYHQASGLPIKYIVIETKAPYNFYMADVSKGVINYGWDELIRLTDLFHQCMTLNAWDKGYEFMQDGPMVIDLPPWIK